MQTSVEVEFKFYVQDIHGRKCPALIRYQYPLWISDYFLRSEQILVNKGLAGYKPTFRKIVLYNSQIGDLVSRTIQDYQYWGNLLITFNPDCSSLSLEDLERLTFDNKLKIFLIKLPLYVQYNGNRKELLIPHQNYDFPLGTKWDDVRFEITNLHKLIHNTFSKRGFNRLLNDAFLYYKSICVIDSVIVPESYTIPSQALENLVLEYNQYKNIPGTTKTYRIDPANTNTMTQKHIHVFFNGEQIYAMNVDGTPHDGSKCVLSKKDQEFLKKMGFAVPEGGILEMYTFCDGTQTLICD